MSTPTVTLSMKLGELENLIGKVWKEAQAILETDPQGQEKADAMVMNLRNALVDFGKRANKIRGAFDDLVDLRDAGTFGSDFVPTVTRIRAKVEGAGRKPTVKADLLDLI